MILKKAFTLIEIGIVLIIIGIILASIMSSIDIIKSTESKQFYQTFARKWSTVIDGYYDRMGKELTDSNNDGFFDGQEPQVLDITSSGINLSKVIGTNQSSPTQYMIAGEYTDYQIVTIYLGAYALNNTTYNFLILKDIPRDIAVAIDKYIDGKSDGTRGNAISIQNSLSNSNLPANLSTITPMGYDLITTDSTNIGIIVEH